MRGGRREGSGRPAPDGARVAINARISREAYQKVVQLAEIEGGIGRALDKMILSETSQYEI